MVRKVGSQSSCGGFNCYRNSLILLNVVYVAVAVSLIALAVYGRTKSYLVDFSVLGGVIACGVLLLMIAAIGLVATVLHHQVTLFFYMIVLVLLFIIQFSIACACLAVTPAQQHQFFEVAWNESLDTPNLVHTLQKTHNCCGASKAYQNQTIDERLNSTLTLGVGPCNLYNSTPECCRDSSSYGCTGNRDSMDACPCQSCWEVIQSDVGYALKAGGGVGLFFSFTEIMGVLLAYRYRNQKNPSANPNDFL